MKRARIIFTALFAVLSAGCIHEFPDDNPVDPTLLGLRVALAVNIDFEIEAGVEQFVQAYAPLFAGGYRIRYLVDLYETPASAEAPLTQRICRLTATDDAMPLNGTYRFSETVQLHPLHYTALVWIDFVPAGSDGDFYYLTDDLQAVTIAGNRPYRGYHISKDAFTASFPIDLTPYRDVWDVNHEATIQTKRPFALYQIVTTDVAKYRAAHTDVPYGDIRPATTGLSYDLWFPMGYNAYRSIPDNFDASGVHYDYEIAETEVEDTEAVIASDFVFVNGNDAFYFVDFGIYTPAPTGALINSHSHIRVNLHRNRLTVIRGDFLTSGTGSDGVGIDFRFGEEIVIFI
ncbi:MAG: hypothetical protein LBD52_05065 [Prevotellaceae bacterium]|jgi:hypothetical protein|nr:hypothetical protein [Prevotellaceae bacterium]